MRRERADPQQVAVNALVEDYQRVARETRLRLRQKRLVAPSLTAETTVPPPFTAITVSDVEEKIETKSSKLTFQGLRKKGKDGDKEKEQGNTGAVPDKKGPVNVHKSA